MGKVYGHAGPQEEEWPEDKVLAPSSQQVPKPVPEALEVVGLRLWKWLWCWSSSRLRVCTKVRLALKVVVGKRDGHDARGVEDVVDPDVLASRNLVSKFMVPLLPEMTCKL
jgi:hypothetical protein